MAISISIEWLLPFDEPSLRQIKIKELSFKGKKNNYLIEIDVRSLQRPAISKIFKEACLLVFC